MGTVVCYFESRRMLAAVVAVTALLTGCATNQSAVKGAPVAASASPTPTPPPPVVLRLPRRGFVLQPKTHEVAIYTVTGHLIRRMHATVANVRPLWLAD